MAALALFIILFLASKIEGKTIIVDVSGNGDFSDLQEAINFASEGDKIIIISGEYGSITINKSISIEGKSIIVGSILIEANNVSISGLIIKDCYYAIKIKGDYNIVRNCSIFNNSHGIAIQGDNNQVLFNKIFRNGYEGIDLEYANYNKIKGNEIYRNAWGIYMEKSHNNMVSQNSIRRNGEGIVIQGGKNNVVKMNNITYNQNKGMHLCCHSEENLIFQNNFIGNKDNVYCYGGVNYWDFGSIGNYWDDYNGSGAYKIYGENMDEYPANEPFNINTQLSYKIYILYPKEGEKVKKEIIIRGIAEQERKVEIKVDDGEWKEAYGVLIWYAKIDTTNLSNGEHIIYARCGNATTFCHIYVDNEKETPAFSLLFLLLAIIFILTIFPRVKFDRRAR